MNPIEKAYSKLKAFLRKMAERTVSGLLAALDACADIFKPAECENYFPRLEEYEPSPNSIRHDRSPTDLRAVARRLGKAQFDQRERGERVFIFERDAERGQDGLVKIIT